MTDPVDAAAALADFDAAGARLEQKHAEKAKRRTHQRLRRNSQPYDDGEGFYRPITSQLASKIMRGAERFAKAAMRARMKGARRGILTDIDLQILEALVFRFMDWRSGRLEPTYAMIAAETGRARATIAASLERLEAAGFIERMRRFRVVEEAEGQKAPQVEQAPNAYRVSLPKRIAILVGLGPRICVPPDDHGHAAIAARIANDVHDAEWTGRSTMGAALARLEEAIRKREFRTWGDSPIPSTYL